MLTCYCTLLFHRYDVDRKAKNKTRQKKTLVIIKRCVSQLPIGNDAMLREGNICKYMLGFGWSRSLSWRVGVMWGDRENNRHLSYALPSNAVCEMVLVHVNTRIAVAKKLEQHPWTLKEGKEKTDKNVKGQIVIWGREKVRRGRTYRWRHMRQRRATRLRSRPSSSMSIASCVC
jgi:hypothetical protein